jgi:hypothetical protein
VATFVYYEEINKPIKVANIFLIFSRVWVDYNKMMVKVAQLSFLKGLKMQLDNPLTARKKKKIICRKEKDMSN